MVAWWVLFFLMTSSTAWRATVYHTSLPEGHSVGTVEVDEGVLVVRPVAGPPLRWDLDEVVVKLDGFNGQTAVISLPAAAGWTVVCAEKGFLEEPEIRHHPAFSRQVGAALKKSRGIPWPLKVAAVLACLLLAGLGYVWTNRAAVTMNLAEGIPVSTEKKIGETVYAQIKAQEKASDDPGHRATVEAITGRLVGALKDKRYEFKFHVVENDAINAFAIPGGHVVIHSALLKAAKRPEEVAGVLAHELAHVTKRHSLRNLISSLGTTLFLQVLAGDATVLAEAGTQLLGLSYSRDFEREADDAGWQYLLDADMDPRGMIEFFKTLRAEEEKRMSMEGLQGLLSTHPATSERIAALEEKAKLIPVDRVFTPIVVVPVPGGA